MGLLISLVVGALIGWVVGLITRSANSGLALNLILGMIGALFGAFLLGPLIGGGNLLDAVIDPMTAFISFVGAVILLGIVHLARARFRRRPTMRSGADESFDLERDVERD